MPEGQPLVSVIMNCLNGEKYLREAIDSVYAQSYQNWEIIFWDNVSSDKSAEIAQGYDEKLKYFRGETTISLGAARNLALEKANGELIAFLDCDDLWMPDKLQKQVPLFNQPAVGLVFSNSINFNDKGQARKNYRGWQPPSGNIFRQLLSGYFLSILTVVVRRSAIDDLEEWFEPEFVFAEEADLFLRICYQWNAEYIDDVLAKRREHKDGWTWKLKSTDSVYSINETFIRESYLIIDKLKQIPFFEHKFQKEIYVFIQNIKRDEAALEMERGNKKECRRLLKPYIKKNVIFMILFAISFFPFELFLLLKQIYYKVVHEITP
ncbi:glycosyltransferase family 2 protein [uncultured Desulfobacter sp.]|uniref:glycosyltransferase family 2 protein n=1 Tax=uncultured Desulfobacter sp. TaxID=240139 RepID=UPI002AAAD39E|nr:glycosyltransferase family 2 protein [uncultured Desulfobacter sp.]